MTLKLGIITCELTSAHGWASYSLNLIQALHRAGVDMTLIAPRNCPDIEGLTIHRLLPNTYPRERRLLPKLALQFPAARRLLANCDVIHSTIEPYAPLAAWVAGQRPLLITGHGSYMALSQERLWPVNTLYRRTFERAWIVCVSRYTEKVVGQILPRARTVVVNNGVDAARFTNLSSVSPVPVRGGVKTILSVGGLKPRKGTLELVRAVAVVRQQIPDVQCVIIGSLWQEAAYVQRVRQTIAELGLESCVQLLGHVPDETLSDWYSRADVFVLPSINDGWKFEGYGIVYLEASAAGLPVIGTTENGAEDAIDDGLTGLLVPQGQVAEALPNAILRLLTDPDLAHRMGEAGRAKALRQTWDHVAAQMLALYNGTRR